MKNRVAFLECDIVNQKGEVKFLEQKKGELVAENNTNVTKGDSLVRELKMADQNTKFVEEQKRKEIVRLTCEIDEMDKKANDEWMILEDYRSNIMKCESIIDDQKLFISFLEDKRATLEGDNQNKSDQIAELIKSRDEFKEGLGRTKVQLTNT